MTVEIDQATLIRAQTAPAAVNGVGPVPIGTPSIVPSSAPISSAQIGVSSPITNMMTTPMDSLINKKADPSQGLYQTCLLLRERLRDVPNFEQFLEPPENSDPGLPEDPVTQLWRCFRLGSSLCVLFNATQPVELIRDRLSPNLKTLNDCKAATFHFLKGIKTELQIDGEDAFMISNLYSDDTNGFVKVTRTVSKILDILKARNLLLNRGNSGSDRNSAEKKPLDKRALVVEHLVDTERKYVQDLEALQDYMRSLEADEIISKDLIHNMFLNLNQLVDFQRRFLIRVETQYDLAPRQQNWGRLFVQYEDSFAVYEPYASNFNSAQDLAQEEKEKLSRKPHPVYAELGAFLIKPVQRITKYPLLLKDLIKNTDPEDAEDQGLAQGLEAIERINKKINEAIRRSENLEIVKDLEGRVEDWKGHRLEHFGLLLLHGQFSVIKGDQKGEVEREYYIYLFERILLCCKEVGTTKKQNKTMSMGRTRGPTIGNKRKSSLQLKGRIFMQNVTDVVSYKGGSYTLQIFWKADPGVENFIIKHTNEENLNQWKTQLESQRQAYSKSIGGRARTSGTQATEFAWMINKTESTDSTDTLVRKSENEMSDEEEQPTDIAEVEDPVDASGLNSGFLMSRNGSNTSLRSRSATNENLPQAATPTNIPGTYARQPPRYPPPTGNSHQPPLTLITTTGISPISQSPDRNAASYFSPVTETPMNSRVSTASSQSQFPFPRQPTPNYYEETGHRYTPTSMSRSTSREGAAITAPSQGQNAAVAHYQGQRLQRPSLPGMHPPNTALAQNRMRSASSPNIHHVPSQAQLARSPGGVIPPMPTVPQTYVAYNGGPAKINRSQNSSPTSPNMPIQGGPTRNGSVATHSDKSSGNTNGGYAAQSQVKVQVYYGSSDKFAIVVPYGIAYAQLMDRIERKIKVVGADNNTPTAPIRIRYQDEDGDYISMSSDDDVQMAFDVSCDPARSDIGGTCGVVTLHVQI
ncbi:Guanine nucleotide exchange factor for Cdc42p [Rhizina undulata]